MESSYTIGFREVIPDQTLPVKWKDIILDTGCTQSTLQDIKATERAGGYSFRECAKNLTRNRFVYWRISQDTLELVDLSLDLTLVNNHLRYKFTDTPLLDGLTVHETSDHVVVLVATVSSVHRLVYPHPARLYVESYHSSVVPSIFAEATLSAAKDPASFHLITRPNSTANCPLPNACATWLCPTTGDAVFSLACATGNMLLVRMCATGEVQLKHMNQTTSRVPRLFANIAEALRGKQDVACTVALELHEVCGETILFCLDADATLRAWAASNPAKAMATEVLVQDGEKEVPGFQRHMMRKSVTRSGQLRLAVYLCFLQEARFLVLTPVLREAGGHVEFVRHTEVFATEYLLAQRDLVDVSVCERRLWAMWRTVDGSPAVTSVALTTEHFPPRWESAVLEEAPPREPPGLARPGADPGAVYTREIFLQGRFSMAVITRALSIYQRSPLLLDHVVHSPRVLQGMVCRAVEEDILRDIREADTDDEDYLEISRQRWDDFYSGCLQYYLSGDKPGGLAVLHNGGLVLVKKQRFSILRPADVLDCLSEHEALRGLAPAVIHDVNRLLQMVRRLEARVPDEQMQAFDTSRHDWRPHDQVAAQLARELGQDDGDENILDESFLSELQLGARQMDDLYGSIELLLSCLSLELPANDELPLEDRQSIGPMYASQLGCSVVAQTLSHVIRQRLGVCRCLLLLESLVSPHVRPTPRSASRRAAVLPTAALLAHCFYVLDWVCGRPARPAQRPGVTVAEMFVHQAAGNALSAIAARHIEGVEYWGRSMMQYVSVIGGMLWPLCEGMVFPDYLYHSSQLGALIGYESLLAPWCGSNVYSRRFLLGCALLRLRQPAKAVECLAQGATGVAREVYILAALQGDGLGPDRAQAVYYLKVMEMLQSGGYLQEAVEVSRSALAVVGPDEPELPMFHWLLFSHCMQLGRYEDAYCAMVDNPDFDKRRDCLHKMIFTLVGQKKINTLLQFPYMGLFSDVERILEGRARTSDVSDGTDYDVLYAWHVRRGNLRKAAHHMYERAYRMERELPPTPAALTRQRGCYLACLNCLRLVASKYRWLARPRRPPQHDGVKVMEVADLKREVGMLTARITLGRTRSDHAAPLTGTGWTAEELVGMLTSARHYSSALKLATLCGLSAERPLEGLAVACVQLQQQPDADAWDWLVNNDLSAVGDGEMNASNTAWKLLEVLLDKHEAAGMTTLHKAVLGCLLTGGFFPPLFLLTGYKRRNPAELLAVLLRAGRLREAADLALEYMAAVLGSGSEHFGGCKQVLAAGQTACLPWQTLDMLLLELDRPNYQQLRVELHRLMVHFIETATRISHQPAVGLAAR